MVNFGPVRSRPNRMQGDRGIVQRVDFWWPNNEDENPNFVECHNVVDVAGL